MENQENRTATTYSSLLGKNQFCSVSLLTSPTIPAINITWVHCLSLSSDCSLLQHGDFLILHGSKTRDFVDKVIAAVREAAQHHASGILLSLFGETLSPEEYAVLSSAGNDAKTPLLYTADLEKATALCKQICRHIILRERFQSTQEQIIRSLLTEENLDERAITNALVQLGFDDHTTYATTVFRIEKTNGLEPDSRRINDSLQKLHSAVLGTYHCFICGCLFQDSLIFILPETYNGKSIQEIMTPLIANFDYKCRCGIGSRWTNIKGFRPSFEVATKLSRLPHRRRVLDIEGQYIFRVLCQFEKTDELFSMYIKLFQPLLDYDKANHSDLMKCLKVYLERNQNLQDSAEELYLHVNTFRNRISKIEDLLHCDIRSDRWQLFRYYFGFFVEDYLSANTNLLNDYDSHSYLIESEKTTLSERDAFISHYH